MTSRRATGRSDSPTTRSLSRSCNDRGSFSKVEGDTNCACLYRKHMVWRIEFVNCAEKRRAIDEDEGCHGCLNAQESQEKGVQVEHMVFYLGPASPGPDRPARLLWPFKLIESVGGSEISVFALFCLVIKQRLRGMSLAVNSAYESKVTMVELTAQILLTQQRRGQNCRSHSEVSCLTRLQ